jgi:hypothetical protein
MAFSLSCDFQGWYSTMTKPPFLTRANSLWNKANSISSPPFKWTHLVTLKHVMVSYLPPFHLDEDDKSTMSFLTKQTLPGKACPSTSGDASSDVLGLGLGSVVLLNDLGINIRF